LTPGVNVIKLFSFVTDNEAQKARGFAIRNPFQSGLEFEGKARVNPLSDASFLGKLLVLPANVRLDW
jgi:hypothetical protein